MATASYAQFVDAVQALNVSGVVRKYSKPPNKFNHADMPCSFIWFPGGDHAPLTFGGGRQFRSRTLDLIVVYAHTAVTADEPFDETVAMMDAVETALDGLVVGQSKPTWSITSQLYSETAERRYWAVIATIQGHG